MARFIPLLGVVFVVSAAGFLRGQAPPYEAVIRQSTAEVRSAPSKVVPIASVLYAQQRVRVKQAVGDWLQIEPPAGSTCWVEERFLDRQPLAGRTALFRIVGDNVPVMLGVRDRAAPVAQQVAALKSGDLVTVLGEKSASEVLGRSSTWWRIQATPREVRYIAREAIAGGTTTSLSPNPAPMNTYPPPPLPPSGGARPAYSSPRPTTPGGWPEGVLMTSGPGVLRRAAFQIDGRPAFVIEDNRGFPRVYVVAQSGLNLEPFINRRVELFGTMVNRPEMTFRGFMSVSKLHLLQ